LSHKTPFIFCEGFAVDENEKRGSSIAKASVFNA